MKCDRLGKGDPEIMSVVDFYNIPFSITVMKEITQDKLIDRSFREDENRKGDRQTDRHIVRRVDRQIEKQRQRLIDRQTDKATVFFTQGQK